jgi:hypothetical protein
VPLGSRLDHEAGKSIPFFLENRDLFERRVGQNDGGPRRRQPVPLDDDVDHTVRHRKDRRQALQRGAQRVRFGTQDRDAVSRDVIGDNLPIPVEDHAPWRRQHHLVQSIVIRLQRKFRVLDYLRAEKRRQQHADRDRGQEAG